MQANMSVYTDGRLSRYRAPERKKFWREEKREKKKEKEEKEGILHTSLLYHAKIPVQTSPRVAVLVFFRTHVESTITPLYTSQMMLTASKKPFLGGFILFGLV